MSPRPYQVDPGPPSPLIILQGIICAAAVYGGLLALITLALLIGA